MRTDRTSGSSERPRAWRSRWAAIGAALAVSLGAGGFFIADAAGGVASSTVLTDPARVLDSRDPLNVGLSGPFASQVSQKLTVTGSIPTATGTKTVVPAGATGVLLNVTAVNPAGNGFISIRPGDAAGAPSTSSLNVKAGDVVPNAVSVALPATGANVGQIDITYDAYGAAGPATDILIDVVGYTVAASTGGTTPGSSAIGITTRRTGDIAVAPYDWATGQIFCPSGSAPVGTGFDIKGDLSFVLVYGSFVGYFLTNYQSTTANVEAQAVCMYGAGSVALTDSSSELLDGLSSEEAFQRDVQAMKLRHEEAMRLQNSD